MNVADHPEYPSGSASFCAAHTTAARRLFNNNDTFPYKIPIMKGQSVVEPGVTPSQDMLL